MHPSKIQTPSVNLLPYYTPQTLAWLVTHLNHVSSQEKLNKMSSQSIATVMGPVLQMSVKLLSALMFHCEAVLPHVEFKVYVPPLTCTSPGLPESCVGIQVSRFMNLK